MDGKKKMSQFGNFTIAAMKTAGAGVPVFVAGQSNAQVPVTDFAANSDLTALDTVVENVLAFIAPVYSDSVPYSAGSIVWHSGAVYRANAATSGVWDPSKWDPVSIAKIVSLIGSVKDGGALVDASSITVLNNAISTLTTTQSSLTLNVNCEPGDVPNFAVEITTTEALTLSVVKIVGSGSSAVVTTLKYSAAGGNELESGKTYQLTCVGSCWTVAEFVDPNAQRSVSPQEQDQEESETRSVVEDEPESSGGTDGDGGDSGSAVR